MITYKYNGKGSIDVFLEKKHIGTIYKELGGGYYYSPKGSKEKGDIFRTLQECQYSLEEE